MILSTGQGIQKIKGSLKFPFTMKVLYDQQEKKLNGQEMEALDVFENRCSENFVIFTKAAVLESPFNKVAVLKLY